MKKQTFEILPLQGVYWKDKDLKLTFGMSVSEFDALIPDATQTTKYQDTECRMLKMPWGILKTNFLMVQFDENKCLNYIYLDLNTNKVNDLCFVLDGNDISGCKRLLKFLLSENKNILEDNHTETLYFTDAGINLTGIHKSSSCRYLEILPAGYYEDLKDDTHPYPEKQILQKLSKNFTILPNEGVANDELGEIKLNTAKNVLINYFTPYCHAGQLSEQDVSWNIQDILGIEFDKETGLITTISLDIKRLNVFYADVKIGKDKKYLDRLKIAKNEIIELPNIDIILVPQDHIAILPYPELIYIMNSTEYESYAKNVMILERQSI